MIALVLAPLIAAYEIATNLAEGHGYSFRGNQSWLFDDRPGDIGYFPTPWVDPVYTILLAALIRAAGDWHLIAGALLNLVLFVAAVTFGSPPATRV